MKTISLVPLLLIFLFSSAVSASAYTVAVTDLRVNSTNPKLTFLGKGISELIAFELGKSKGVSLIEREKRAELLKELELSQTGLIDDASQIRAGKLLAAKYIVSGDITDMGDTMLVTMRMIDVETGQVVWRDKVSDKLANYDYISGFFAISILKQMNAAVDTTTTQKVAEKKEKNEDAAIAFSRAIDLYDQKNDVSAMTELERAKLLDPDNRLADIYLSKLSTTSPKYRVQLEAYAPTDNPASLGMLKQDRIYFFQSMPTDMTKGAITGVGDGYRIDEQNSSNRFGYAFPIGERFGMSAEFIHARFDNKIETPFTFPFEGQDVTYFHPAMENFGGCLSAGFAFSENVSIGAGLHVYRSTLNYDMGPGRNYTRPSKTNTAGDAGFLLQGWNGTVVFDSHAVFTTQKEDILDTKKKVMDRSGLPTLVESTFTAAFLSKKLFISFKNIDDIYTGVRSGYVVRAIPVIEFWPAKFISLRGGYQFAAVSINSRRNSGHGFMAGGTLRLWTFDIDVNYTQRYQPSRILPGYGRNEGFMLIGITKNDTFLSR